MFIFLNTIQDTRGFPNMKLDQSCVSLGQGPLIKKSALNLKLLHLKIKHRL